MWKSLFIIFLSLIGIGFSSTAQDPCINRTLSNPYVTSWIANDGGTQKNHVPHWMEYMTVSPDGRIATVTGWDEGGSNVVVFKDGVIINVPEGSGTGGYGRNSMIGVALDSNYVYHLQSQHGCDGGNSNKNINGLPQYPPCINGEDNTWRTVRRYKIGTTGFSNFPLGYGYSGNMMIVDTGSNDLNGIAVSGNEIFVSDTKDNSVRVYNKTTMSSTPLRKFGFNSKVGQLAADQSGGIWMLISDERKIIRFSASSGAILPQEISFSDESIVPTTFFVDSKRDRILVADNGVNQNIRIYTMITDSPVFSDTFGDQFGIFSGVPGKYAPGKLFDIRGVGVDSSGNIYVANSIDVGGAVLQAYSPEGQLLWDKKGLVFTSTACPDPEEIENVYTCDKKMILDYTKTIPGSEWSFDAITLNRFKYPDDPRIHGGFFTSSWIRIINGEKYLFTTDMYASMLAGFRFQPETDGEVAIPMLLMNVSGWNTQSPYPTVLGSDKDFIWMDKNGDGQIQQDEFSFKDGFDSPYSMSVWVDSTGNIWKGIREKGIRLIQLESINEHGVLLYDLGQSKLLNISNGEIGINGVKRLAYNPSRDELFVAGFSNEMPDRTSTGEAKDTWWCMGSTICKYSGVLDTIGKNPDMDFKNVNPSWRVFIPFYPEGDPAGITEDNAKSFTIEDNYLFVTLARNGKINIYETSDGGYLTQMKPGPEVNRESGWTDINYSINVVKTESEFLLFNEENAFAKVILYRIPNLETIDTFYPDAEITSLELLNEQNQVVINPKPSELLHFRARVKNNGPGVILDGTQTTNHISFVVTFISKDLTTNVSTLFKADTFSLGLSPGESVNLINNSQLSPSEWLVGRGKFNISARVSLSVPNQECKNSNNSMNFVVASYDTAYIFTDPKSLNVFVNKPAQFTVEAYGTEPLTYTWYINGIAQDNSNNSVFIIGKASNALNNAKVSVSVSNGLGIDLSSEAILTVTDPYGPSRPGKLLREVWYDIPGTAVEDLTGNSRYPDSPDLIDFVDAFEIPSNAFDNYGVKLSGWLIPPQTGNYTFYFASDDNGKLYLSTDSLQENLSINPLAYVNDWADPRQYTKFPEQTSEEVYLVSGKQYYAEAIFKEGSGGDNLSVAWKLPDGTKEVPVSSPHLSFNTGNPVLSVPGEIGLPDGTLRLFPNPASEKVSFVNPGEIHMVKVSIFEISGRVVYTDAASFRDNSLISLDISGLDEGIYIVRAESNNTVKQGRFVLVK